MEGVSERIRVISIIDRYLASQEKLMGMRLAMGNSFATVVSAEMIAADVGAPT